MAINYLNSIDLNQNELIHGTIENQASDALAGTPVEGQLYFNTTAQVLKVGREILPATNPKTYEWVEVGGGVETLDTSNGTYINLTPTTPATGDVIVTADLSAADGTVTNAARFLTKDNKWAVPAFDDYSSWSLDGDSGTAQTVSSGETVDIAGGLKITTDIAANRTLNIVHDLQAQTDGTSTAAPGYGGTFTVVDTVTRDTTGHVTGINVKTVTIPASDNTNTTYGLDKAAGSANLILAADGTAQDTIVFAGTTNQIEVDVATEDSYTFKFPTAGVVLPDGSTATTQATGDNSTKVATTAFVQASVTGLLEFKGGFNANTGVLDDGSGDDLYTDVVIAVGDYYVVTTDGDFFGNAATPLTVGDSVIAQNAVPNPGTTPAVEGDFIVVQSDTDLATATTVGLGNVVPGTSATVTAPYTNGTATLDVVDSTASQKGAVIVAQGGGINVAYSNGTATVSGEDSSATNKGIVIVSPSDPIEVSYASGTATVGIKDSAATQKGAVIVSGGTGISVAYSGGTATVTSTVQSDNSFSGTIGDGTLTSLPITSATHGLGADSSSFMVQLVEVSSGETVYAGVTRGASGLVTIDFAVAPATNAIRVLIQKIG